MSVDVREISLHDAVKFIVDNRGKTVPTADNGIPLIATNCIKNNGLFPVFEKIRFVSEETYKTWFRSHPEPGDIIFVNKGTPGRVCLVPNPVNFCIAQDMVALRVDESVIYPKYLFAALRSDYIQNVIENMHVGTLIPHFKKSDFERLMIPVPDEVTQKYIGNLYYDLSMAIELNNQINKTLEEMARAIFKSWFVDFEPFKDGEFEESELGLIPKGWKVGMLGDFVEVVDNRGKTPPLSDVKTEYPIIDVRALSGESRVIDYNNCTKYVEKEIYDSWFRNGHPKQLDILISTVGSISEMKMFYGNKGCIAQNVVAFRSNGISPFYLYQYLQYSKGDLLSYNIGSVQPSIKVTHVIKYKIIVPDEKTMSSFDMLIESISDQIYRNANESQILIAIRDTLLPKLMSGEIRVPVDEVI